MNSKYLKQPEKEIKKSKSEINFHLNFDKINTQKELQNMDIKNENSKNKSHSENNQNDRNNNNDSKTIEEITDYNLEENKQYTIKSLDSENSEENKENETNSKIKNYEINNDIELKSNFKQLLSIIPNNDIFCRCCGKKYDEKIHIPILLKCNHSFCKICLGKYFTEDNNFVCPIDGPTEKISFEDLKNINNDSKENNAISSKTNNNYNNRNKGNNKKRNINSIKSLIHKSSSQQEFLKYKNSFYKKGCNKININDKLNNFMNNSKNSIQYFSLTNRNKDLNFNLYNKKFINKYSEEKNPIIKFNKTSYKIQNDESSKNNIHKIKKIPKKKSINYRSKSVLNNNNNSNSDNIDEEESENFCSIHPEQRISHFVEDTKELICIHCAFNKLKNDPNIQIKEIPEKCKEYISDLESIIENNKNYIQIIKNSIGHIDENKQNEEKKISEIYEELTNLLITNRNNYLIKIEEIYQQNKSKMNKKLENFEEIIEISEKLKEDFSRLHNVAPIEFNFLTQAFNQFIREINDKNNSEIHIIQYNFSHDEANKIIKYINNFADVKSKKKVFKFDLAKTTTENKEDYDNLIDLTKLINAESQKNTFQKYFKVTKPMKNINSNNNIFSNYYIKNKSSPYNNNFLNYYKDSENINEILNKYASSSNLIRDSLHSASNPKNSSIENNANDNNNIYKYLKYNERLSLLKKYKYPLKISNE